jgi:hypothetical protein
VGMRVTADQLQKKKRREKDVPWTVTGDDGETYEATMLFRAIGAEEYDELLAQHPPSQEQKKKGLNYNPRSFAPALLSQVCVDPEMSEAQWAGLWKSPDWNRGELQKLFMEAVDVCSVGFDIPFIDTD